MGRNIPCFPYWRTRPFGAKTSKSLCQSSAGFLLSWKIPLNEKLLRASLGDLKRLEELSGKKLSVDTPMYLAKVSFKNVNGKNVRVDVKALPEEQRDKMWFYQVSFC